MMDEISRIYGFLERLLESCADHDITTDIFVSQANPESYRTALERIRECCDRITASGINREGLLRSLPEDLISSHPVLKGIVEPEDLLPLIGAEFTTTQEEIICTACREWGMATLPDDPEGMANLIRSSLQPLSLADILSAEVTGMLRFPTIVLLQNAGRVQGELIWPAWDPTSRILVPANDDPAVFHGKLNVAIFWFIHGKGIVPDPLIQGPVLQALYDTGLFSEGGTEALGRGSIDEREMVFDLFDAGRGLAKENERITDIRTLFGLVLEKTAEFSNPFNSAQPERNILLNYGRIGELGGHVLAGYVSTPAGISCSAGVSRILDFIRSVAARPSGREDPDPSHIRDMERNVLESEQLVRAVTGDYRWRALPMPRSTGGYRPFVDLWHERYIILYDKDEAAYRSTGALKALVMETLYRHWYGLRPAALLAAPDRRDWYIRLVSVLGVPRAFRTGTGIHPGVVRWMESLLREEYHPVNRMVNSSRIARLSLPDQYLEGAVFEGRTGETARDIRDTVVKYALEVTSMARREIGDPQLPGDICRKVIQEQIWPVFLQLCDDTPGTGSQGSIPDARSHAGPTGSRIISRGSVPRVATTVPSAHRPANDLTGRSIEGKGASLLDDDGLLAPGGSQGTGVKQADRKVHPVHRNMQAAGAGAATISSPFPGRTSGHPWTGDHLQGMPETAGRMMEACTKSRDLLDKLSSGTTSEEGNSKGPNLRETVSSLNDLAKKIDELADTLRDQVQHNRDVPAAGITRAIQSKVAPDRVHEHEKVHDALLKVSEKIKKAAREYREALGKVEHQIESSTFGQERIQHLTGMTRNAFTDLQQAGAEFQRISGGPPPDMHGGVRPMVRMPEADDDPDSDGQVNSTRRGKLEPSFAADCGYSPGIWESLSYFDASFDDGSQAGPDSSSSGRSRDGAEQRFEQNTQALTREAEIYLSSLRQRTRSEWETIDEKAERIRRVALFESYTVGQDDYSTYQRFYQPVAGLIVVARKNIQQALQKTRATRDLNELITGDDIDEENLAAVRTTMRIFRDRGREPDKARWCISLLIDASSSMHDETVARKLQATIQTAILFGEAINRVPGIRFEIAAFSDTEYIPLKRYQDDWNIHQGCYLIRQVIQATGGTNDVGAVSSALDRMNRLHMATGANRMIFVISDGQSGVGGREQMRTILATNKDTRIFGWGIGPDMEKIEETYRPYGTWVPDIADLPRSMGEVLRRELGRPAMAGWKDDRAGPGTGQDTEAGEALCTD
ncbi:MAG: vWA domain-containing protein [Methanomicrobiales archaeon]